MDNIIDIESKRNKKQENCEHEEVCGHCTWVNDTTTDFVDRIKELDVTSDAYEDEVRELIEYVEHVTRKQTLLGIAGGIMAEVDEIDGDIED